MKAKMSAIFAALVVGLVVAGASYAVWTQDLAIGGTVATGEVDAQITDCVPSDNEGVPDIGETACNPVLGQDGNRYSAEITIGNAYPGYVGMAALTITNTGTLPIALSDLTYSPPVGLSIIDDLTPGTVIAPNGATTINVNVEVTTDADELSIYSFTATTTAALP